VDANDGDAFRVVGGILEVGSGGDVLLLFEMERFVNVGLALLCGLECDRWIDCDRWMFLFRP